MALVAADWSIDRSTKVISYDGDDHGGASPSYATVIQFHRWLQDLADDAVASGDDELDITNTDPSRRSTDNIITLINGYTIDETANNATEHLYDGSIIMDGGDTIYDGIVNFGDPEVVIQIIQDGAVLSDDWWNFATGFGANADDAAGISHRFMVQTRKDGVDIDGRRLTGTTRVMDTGAGTAHFTFSEFKINGTSRGNNVLALTNSDDLNNSTSETTISGWTDITNTEGLNLIDVNADTTNEEYYSKWDTSGSHTQNDYYERLKWLTRDGSASTIHGMNGELFRGITHSFAWDADAGTQPVTNDYVVWGTNVVFNGGVGTFTVGEAVHEDTATPVWKGRVLGYTGAGATGSLIIAIESGTVTTGDSFTGQSSSATADANGTPTVVTGGGVGVCLAVDDDGGAGNLYIQLIRGTIAGDNAIWYNAQTNLGTLSVANTLTQFNAATARTVSTPFVGVSTGTNIIGAYGIGFETDQIDDGDTLTALDGNPYSRPNLVTNTVGGLSQDGDDDRVIVAEWDTVTDGGGGAGYDVNGDPLFNKKQMAINATYTSADQATITIGHANGDNVTIPSDTPSSGTIRVLDDNDFERWIPYSSWSGTVFTVNTGHPDIGNNNDFDGVNATTGNLCYVTYIDENAATATLNFQSTYSADRPLVVVVRNGFSTAPIKQFIAEWSLTANNQQINAIRTTDL
jgi:hypothetical protein